jgi:hypothetical protein
VQMLLKLISRPRLYYLYFVTLQIALGKVDYSQVEGSECVNWIKLPQGSVALSCEYGNELLGSIKVGNFLD